MIKTLFVCHILLLIRQQNKMEKQDKLKKWCSYFTGYRMITHDYCSVYAAIKNLCVFSEVFSSESSFGPCVVRAKFVNIIMLNIFRTDNKLTIVTFAQLSPIINNLLVAMHLCFHISI